MRHFRAGRRSGRAGWRSGFSSTGRLPERLKLRVQIKFSRNRPANWPKSQIVISKQLNMQNWAKQIRKPNRSRAFHLRTSWTHNMSCLQCWQAWPAKLWLMNPANLVVAERRPKKEGNLSRRHPKTRPSTFGARASHSVDADLWPVAIRCQCSARPVAMARPRFCCTETASAAKHWMQKRGTKACRGPTKGPRTVYIVQWPTFCSRTFLVWPFNDWHPFNTLAYQTQNGFIACWINSVDTLGQPVV